MKISEAFNYYGNNYLLANGMSTNTYESYRYAGKSAVAFFGDVQLRRLSQDDISEYSISLQKKMSKNAARNYIVCLRRVAKYCRRKGARLGFDPDEVSLPKPAKEVANFLTKEQYQRFLTYAGASKRGYPEINRIRNVLIVKILFNTGLRVSELVALNRDSIVDRQFIVVGKSKEPRVCYVTAELEKEIQAYLELRTDGNEALFVSNQTGGERLSIKTVQDMFRRVSKEAKMPGVHPHTMRHSFATYILERGVDIRDVAQYLGHQSVNTTQRYTHMRDSRLKAQYDLIMQNC